MERKHLALLILLILAIATRFFGIEYQSLWIDEGATYYFAHYTWEQMVQAKEPNSPIFYFLEGWMLDHLGHSEFALRFVSAVAGVVVVMMSYLVTEKLFKNWRLSILVAILFLISVYCIEYSQEARGYEIALMLFLFQLYVFLYAMDTRKIVYWILFFLFGVAAFAMQYTAVLATVTLVLYALYVFYREMKQNGNYRPLLGLIIVCIIPLVLSYPLWGTAFDALSSHFSAGMKGTMYIGPIYTIEVFFRFLSRIQLIAIVMFVLLVFGAIYCRKNHRKEFSLLLWIMLFPLLLTTIVSCITNMDPRYILWSIPPYLIFVAMSFYYWGTDKEALKHANIVAVVSIVLVAGAALPAYYTEPTKHDFRGTCQELEAYASEGDVLVYSPAPECLTYATISFYYDAQAHGVKVFQYESHQQIENLSNDPQYGNVFVLVDNYYDPYDYLMSSRSETCACVFNGFGINLFMITAPL